MLYVNVLEIFAEWTCWILVLRKDQWKSPPIESQRIHNSWNLNIRRISVAFFHIVLKVNFMPSKLTHRATKLRANYAISNCPLLHTVESDLYLSLTLKVKYIFHNSDCKSLMYSQKSLRSRYRFTELRIYGKTEDL